jgi:hypothetical protein
LPYTFNALGLLQEETVDNERVLEEAKGFCRKFLCVERLR